jgi:enoyl-CoA hydratase/carnithine racemase
MAYEGYRRLHLAREGRIVTAIVDNPPINIITLELYAELARLAAELEADPDPLVFVLKSADPDFFLAHFDVAAILGFPIDQPASREHSDHNAYHVMCERFRTMDKVTIAQIEGRVGGGGSELAMSFDLRFGVIGKTVINQMEVPIGILPGGTGTQRLPRLIGRHRAIEVILGGIDLDAETAERWGYLNRALAADAIGGAAGQGVDQFGRQAAGRGVARRKLPVPAPAARGERAGEHAPVPGHRRPDAGWGTAGGGAERGGRGLGGGELITGGRSRPPSPRRRQRRHRWQPRADR